MAYKLIEIEGIGEKHAATIKEKLDIHTVEALLEKAASKKGREEVASKTGISESLILRWVNMADLFRIKGIAQDFAELLEKAGVDTVKELRNRTPLNLHARISELNEATKRAGRTPALSEVENWILQAKEMEPMVTH